MQRLLPAALLAFVAWVGCMAAACGTAARAERREAHERRDRGRKGVAARTAPCVEESADDVAAAARRDMVHGDRMARSWVDAGADPACRALAVARVFAEVDPGRALAWAEEAVDGDRGSAAAARLAAIVAARTRNAPRAVQLLVLAEHLAPAQERGAASIDVSRELGKVDLTADAITAARQAVSLARPALRGPALERLISAARAAGRVEDAERAWSQYAATLPDDAARAEARARIEADAQ